LWLGNPGILYSLHLIVVDHITLINDAFHSLPIRSAQNFASQNKISMVGSNGTNDFFSRLVMFFFRSSQIAPK
jgi:hypothetical protein